MRRACVLVVAALVAGGGSGCSRVVDGLGSYAGGEVCRAEYYGELTGPGAPDKVIIRAHSTVGGSDTEATYNLHDSEDVRSVTTWLTAANLAGTSWCWS